MQFVEVGEQNCVMPILVVPRTSVNATEEKLITDLASRLFQ